MFSLQKAQPKTNLVIADQSWAPWHLPCPWLNRSWNLELKTDFVAAESFSYPCHSLVTRSSLIHADRSGECLLETRPAGLKRKDQPSIFRGLILWQGQTSTGFFSAS